MTPVDSLEIQDSKKYPDRLKQATGGDGRDRRAGGDAGRDRKGARRWWRVSSSSSWAASMGSVVGERFARGVDAAIKAKCGFVSIAASGGAHAGKAWPR